MKNFRQVEIFFSLHDDSDTNRNHVDVCWLLSISFRGETTAITAAIAVTPNIHHEREREKKRETRRWRKAKMDRERQSNENMCVCLSFSFLYPLFLSLSLCFCMRALCSMRTDAHRTQWLTAPSPSPSPSFSYALSRFTSNICASCPIRMIKQKKSIDAHFGLSYFDQCSDQWRYSSRFSHGGRYCPTATADWAFHH